MLVLLAWESMVLWACEITCNLSCILFCTGLASKLFHTLSVQFPVLETAQGSLCESAAISRYIASLGQNNLYPLPFNPTGKSQTARCLPCISWCHAFIRHAMPCTPLAHADMPAHAAHIHQ